MTGAEAGETRAQRRERERAERAQWDYLTERLGVLWPNYDCFCGSLDDLRRTVAELERKAARGRPARERTDRARSARGTDAAAPAPARQVSSVARAGLRANRQISEDIEQDQSRREQLTSWHTADRALEHGSADDDGAG
ncbi:hypothetical protein PHK61_24995 [Actinomycetospora lutea]|uniref:hypothetical protein n=1 Tax=Actinomycetospora lutea TaxID=663604 RepID=UPI00236539E3|nr:hypothetical protein [Actinomycetospora lutea]MDD7941683.1 hypothetical protein [Actinomycetospora lutea]